ncbi:MAG: hypothetical protein AMXMBFR84_31830 [Candidatus Hydrogenedentota bacterium]
MWHIVEGEAGCQFAIENKLVAVIVDALRASATAASLLEAGATAVWAVREIEDALEAEKVWPDALLYGERGGLPPVGFDFGNSPREADAALGRRVIFTTTTGAGRLVQSRGAAAVYMGSTVNGGALVRAVSREGRGAVIIPAGLMTDPSFPAQEDWVAAVSLARASGETIGEGSALYETWCERIRDEGVPALFESAPHSEKLRTVGLESDIAFCAQSDIYGAVPRVADWNELGGILLNAREK